MIIFFNVNNIKSKVCIDFNKNQSNQINIQKKHYKL